jgi:tryptophanase
VNLPEPFRIRSVERIHLLPREARRAALARAGYNPFRLLAREVFIDLLTDSGTGSMSDRQWASLHCADESYAGSASYERFVEAVRRVTGYPEVIPTHQGRAAERIMMDVLVRKGDVVVSNALFDTTRANVERAGALGVDLSDEAVSIVGDASPFKGGMDLGRLEQTLRDGPVRLVIMTCTSNSTGGHPVTVQNVRAVSALCRQHGVPMFIDGARFAENAAMLIRRDPALEDRSAEALAREIFDLADGCLVSAKKNGLAHIGGFIALRDPALAQSLRENLIVTEGFETYGGLAGRDLDAIAVGLIEALDDEVLQHRISQAETLHAQLRAFSVPVMSPAGGHAVYVDGAAMLPHVPAEQFPAHAVACALYAEAGVRACEIGSLMFPGRPAGAPELTRLAIPWRTYTASHLTYVAEALGRIAENARGIGGLRVVSAPPALRHFRAVMAPL